MVLPGIGDAISLKTRSAWFPLKSYQKVLAFFASAKKRLKREKEASSFIGETLIFLLQGNYAGFFILQPSAVFSPTLSNP